MRLAYVLKLGLADSSASGVLKKVLFQAETWQALGTETRLFCLTPNLPSKPVPTGADLDTFPYSGLAARLRQSHALCDAVLAWRPDAVYLRYAAYQPGYRRLMRAVPTIVEVNSDDVHEMRWFRARNRLYNRLTRSLVLGSAAGLVFVSHELSTAAPFRRFTPARVVIGNGIQLTDDVNVNRTPATDGRPHLICLGSPAYPWVGADKIIALARMRPQWHFDMVGWMDADLGPNLPANVTCHGWQPRGVYEQLIMRADVGIGPLALHRNSMSEASSLKVREYLAAGLPVVLAGRDTDFPDGADFILQLPNTESNVIDALPRIDAFIQAMRGRRVARERVAHLDWSVKETDRLRFIATAIGNSAS